MSVRKIYAKDKYSFNNTTIHLKFSMLIALLYLPQVVSMLVLVVNYYSIHLYIYFLSGDYARYLKVE